jgi:hypothetical protein
MENIAPAASALLASALVAGSFVRLVRLDGHGHRAAPRGPEDWTADGLPSRPYGC